MVALATSLVAK